MVELTETGVLTMPRAEPRIVTHVARLSHALNVGLAAFAALLLALMTGLILVEIVLRFFSMSTFMADTLVGHGVAAITFLALGWTLETGGMIRVRLLPNAAGPAGRWLLEMFAVLSTFAVTCFISNYVLKTMLRSLERGTVSEHMLPIPLWIPDAFFLIGLALIALQLVVRFLKLVTVGVEDEPEVVV